MLQEKPVELATKLADHDQKKYRAEELLVARDVTALSEHPEEPKLRKNVDKMVAESKTAKAKMESDLSMLNQLQNAAGSSNFGGTRGYNRLKERSVDVAKNAERIAKHADTFAEKGHIDRQEAAKVVKKVEEAMKAPVMLHEKAEAERGEYKTDEKRLAELRKLLDQQPMHTLLAAQDKRSKYSEERSELRKVLESEEGKKKAHTKIAAPKGDSVRFPF